MVAIADAASHRPVCLLEPAGSPCLYDCYRTNLFAVFVVVFITFLSVNMFVFYTFVKCTIALNYVFKNLENNNGNVFSVNSCVFV